MQYTYAVYLDYYGLQNGTRTSIRYFFYLKILLKYLIRHLLGVKANIIGSTMFVFVCIYYSAYNLQLGATVKGCSRIESINTRLSAIYSV
jgi:hypothetical protein